MDVAPFVAATAFIVLLAAAGVRVELHGPRGRVAMIDPERTSRLGALLTGSPHVTLDRAGWALPVRAVLPPRVVTLVGPAVGVIVAAGGALLWARHRRR